VADTTYYVNTDSTAGGTGLTNATTGADRAFATLSAAEALNLNLTTGATDGVCTIYCSAPSGVADTTAVTWDGWTTDAAGYVNVVGNFAGTKWDTTKYRLAVTSATRALYINDQYVRISHLQISNTGLTGDKDCVSIGTIAAGGSDIRITSCYIRGSLADTGFGLQGIIVSDADVTVYIVNTIVAQTGDIADTGSFGISIANCTNVYLYNCTVASCRIGISQSAGTVVATNCVVINTANDFSGTITVDHCASDDADGTNAQDFTAEATDWNKVFTDYANGDFTLKNYTTSPCCVGTGTDDPGAGLYSDDITGTARTSVWDIGADEYVAAAGGLSIPVAMAHYMRRRSS
jgi:hypothetical protein